MSANNIPPKSPIEFILSRRSSRDSLRSTGAVECDEYGSSKPIESFTVESKPVIYIFIPSRSPTIPSLPNITPQPISMPSAIAMIIVCVTASIISNASSVSMNLLIPSIQRQLGIQASDLQWISSGFPLGFGSCLLLFGRLADLYGHKRFIQVGTGFYALASLGCALSRNHVQLSILRVCQGLGAAATAPSIIGVLGNHLEPESILKRVGFAGLSAGLPLGTTFSLLVGGFITQEAGPGWRSFFYLCAASAIAVCVSATLIIPKDRQTDNKEGSIDWLGGVLIIAGLTGLILSLGTSSREGSNKAVVIVTFIFSIIILGCFVFWQRILEIRINESLQGGVHCKRITQPILKLDLFRRDHHQFLILLMVVCLLWSGFVSQNFFFHQYLQDYLGLDLHKSVIRFIPMPLVGLLLNITFGFLSHIVPAKILIVLGCMGTATSCLLSALMDTSARYWTYNFASVALSVVGPGFVVS
ncbi:uncharacterized protein PGTG_14890 [Puccinia graminis f. sp. tritici CRL 75-36-700-3]|uniref:Major facilitator superfamily (MFS) profile domain-containing protein n=1 Tax=Puccinia graminis f. sp. tritici (strain CRL 75-36-700-3 / race SCCL) TaxID=418459 RepID=E3KXW3_PUCGT|nr:uncharacterized protein PGTG_14890 [Puccinia graminis f. sp. tritici CRL 75-36-700-3]EFP89049.2 hypothetical protein PGTG_14890 [Puccinia graminis f. sp. tritici CRL 75-36-700-3]